MARKIFFSFHYSKDVMRVAIVRKSGVIGSFEKTPFYDKADWEKLKRTSPTAIRDWIEAQLKGTSVTVVLVGTETASRPWVKYEIERSIQLGKGLIGIDISKIRVPKDSVSTGAVKNPLPKGCPFYLWNNQNGAINLAKWVEAAAAKAGR